MKIISEAFIDRGFPVAVLLTSADEMSDRLAELAQQPIQDQLYDYSTPSQAYFRVTVLSTGLSQQRKSLARQSVFG